MALIQPINNIIRTMLAINEGNESAALSYFGVTKSNNLISNQYSFLDKVCGVGCVAENNSNSFVGGLLTTPDSADIKTRTIINEAMGISYGLVESISFIATNSLSAISALSEDVSTDAILDSNGINNIRSNFTEGVSVMKDALSEVFSGVTRIAVNARKSFNEILGENSLYSNLITNAVAGASLLYNIDHINKFVNNSHNIISEASNTNNIFNRSDNVLFGTLDLQENSIDMFIKLQKFNKEASNVFTLSNPTLFKNTTEYIDTALKAIALPISEGKIHLNEDMTNTFNFAINSISALYDQYMQDYNRI